MNEEQGVLDLPMEENSFELKWEIYELPESSRVYWVEGTRIQKVYGLLPNPKEGIYSTYNAAKRAVARYRRTSKDYEYSHPGSAKKNICKYLSITIDETFEKEPQFYELFPTTNGKFTVKISKIKSGLSDYKRGDNDEGN